ncbi:hypothetical protein DFH07DRAFT_429331 [Mycena maculata]|uniref:Uncharacterized protein n=1 Tax=Mycena maculata TaxID=230809 RepID=A0AAD7JAG5_9AGAR|nr:hypothetical protein DFH07DRAFT_429331 [Mycena maculata]
MVPTDRNVAQQVIACPLSSGLGRRSLSCEERARFNKMSVKRDQRRSPSFCFAGTSLSLIVGETDRSPQATSPASRYKRRPELQNLLRPSLHSPTSSHPHSSSLQWTLSPLPLPRSRTSSSPPSTTTPARAPAGAASSARRKPPSPPSTRTAAPAPAVAALLLE